MSQKKSGSLAKKLIADLIDDELSVDLPTGETTAPAKAQANAPASAEERDDTIAIESAEDKTEAIQAMTSTSRMPPHPEATNQKGIDHTIRRNGSEVDDQVRAGVGRFAILRTGAPSPTDASLAQAENLRIAQGRILELEAELEKLRQNNEHLASAGELLRKRADENMAQVDAFSTRFTNLQATHEEERSLLQKTLQVKDADLQSLKGKVEEMEMRLTTNLQKVRVRERELENRLELVKMESQALLRSKDEMILDHKRQIDQLNLELDNYRNKGQDLNKQIQEKQELLRRTVKALRLALSMLEGDDSTLRVKKEK
jgi:vacuolar-type H+-ATPase subunit I/STV1